MPSYNKIIMIGHLTRNPELKYTDQGTPVASFGLASNRVFKQGDDLKKEVCFVDVVVFGKLAEVCAQYLQKGSAALVEGELQQQRWEEEGGKTRSKHQIRAVAVKFMSGRGDDKHEEHEG